MADKREKIKEMFKNADTVDAVKSAVDLQKGETVIKADELLEKLVSVCGLDKSDISLDTVSRNIMEAEEKLKLSENADYKSIPSDLVSKRRTMIFERIDGLKDLDGALSLFNEISDYDVCLGENDGGVLIRLDRKIGPFCLDLNNVRSILSDLNGFLRKEWKASKRLEISKFYDRIYEKYCVVFFSALKKAKTYESAVKYIECAFFNCPEGFRVADGMPKIVTSEEMIDNLSGLCIDGSKDKKESAARADKICNLVNKIDKGSAKSEYFCSQLRKRTNGSSLYDNKVVDGQKNAASVSAIVEVTSFEDILSYPQSDEEWMRFYDFCKSDMSGDENRAELYYMANAVRLLIDEDLDKLPEATLGDSGALLWGHGFYNTVYDSYFNEKNQFYVLSSFSESMPAIGKKISDFVRAFYENKKDSLEEKNFAAVCVAYPNSFSKPYYVDAEKAIELVGKKNDKLICKFIEFCLSNDFTQYPIAAYVVEKNSENEKWAEAVKRFGMIEEMEEDYGDGANKGVWAVVLLLIVLAAGAAVFFFMRSQKNKNETPALPSDTETVITDTTETASETDAETTLSAVETTGETSSEETTETSVEETTETEASETADITATETQAPTTTTAAPTTTATTKASSTTTTRRQPTTTTAAKTTTSTSAITTSTENTTSTTENDTTTTEETPSATVDDTSTTSEDTTATTEENDTTTTYTETETTVITETTEEITTESETTQQVTSSSEAESETTEETDA